MHFRNAGTGHQGLKWYKDSNLGVSFSYGEGNANPTLNIYRQDSQSGFPYGSLIINTGHGTTPTQALKLRTDKNIELAGSLIMANGQGIDFSATSDATGKTSETLDDYEEGTWSPTPVVTYNSGNYALSSTSNISGTYTKVGNLVHCEFICSWVLSGNTGGYNVGINGLPFTSQSTVNVNSGVGRNDSGKMFICENINGTQINVLRRYDNGGPNTTDTMHGFVSYQAAT